ncbi:hypothetical protein [Jongsikchunia kroppenstedtii]|uniref:hypothetical protein n=1 Tax=Jongsikchunia kroppenstedtii TaxID=1121721 RepID=UPI00037663EE|nr:hypothetical protein [Jongsikchunia kroppenstedtii]
MSQNRLTLSDVRSAPDIAAFLGTSLRAGGPGVVRMKERPDGLLGLWVTTGFEVLATRATPAEISSDDLVVDAQSLRDMLRTNGSEESIDVGMSVASAWTGALPPDGGYTRIDDVPARVLVQLARDGAEVARTEGGPKGPPASLLDQSVLTVTGSAGAQLEIPMRAVFALSAMGFIRLPGGDAITENTAVDEVAADEPVRVSMAGSWGRLDARYGSIYFRRPGGLTLSVV